LWVWSPPLFPTVTNFILNMINKEFRSRSKSGLCLWRCQAMRERGFLLLWTGQPIFKATLVHFSCFTFLWFIQMWYSQPTNQYFYGFKRHIYPVSHVQSYASAKIREKESLLCNQSKWFSIFQFSLKICSGQSLLENFQAILTILKNSKIQLVSAQLFVRACKYQWVPKC
jgi:hypothetical protein